MHLQECFRSEGANGFARRTDWHRWYPLRVHLCKTYVALNLVYNLSHERLPF